MGSPLVIQLRSKWYPFGPDPLHEGFFGMISSRLQPGVRILDVGCGKGTIYPYPWKQYADKHLVGMDPDPGAAKNPYLDEFIPLSNDAHLERWPVEAESFDLVLARFVLEHVAKPPTFLSNVSRVLKPGGEFIFSTPNRLHPAMVASRMLPLKVKQKILSSTISTSASDVFATFYRMNTASDILRHVRECGGLVLTEMHVSDRSPIGYLDFSLPTFLAAAGYYEMVKWSKLERFLGSSIVGAVRKS